MCDLMTYIGLFSPFSIYSVWVYPPCLLAAFENSWGQHSYLTLMAIKYFLFQQKHTTIIVTKMNSIRGRTVLL